MKKLRFIFDIEFDKFSEIRKIMKDDDFDSLEDFFGDFLIGVIEEEIGGALSDVDCIARESKFRVEEK